MLISIQLNTVHLNAFMLWHTCQIEVVPYKEDVEAVVSSTFSLHNTLNLEGHEGRITPLHGCHYNDIVY